MGGGERVERHGGGLVERLLQGWRQGEERLGVPVWNKRTVLAGRRLLGAEIARGRHREKETEVLIKATPGR
jgi:hypothetical protein